jgi:hypothetical protein
MDRRDFDRIARAMAQGSSRRRVFGMLAGAAAAALGARTSRAQMAPASGAPAHFVCGGRLGDPCPDGYDCVPPASGCDPMSDRNCLGDCVLAPSSPCATMRCMAGTICCDNCGGVCVPQGVACSDALCQDATCGTTVCGDGEYCCNASCSRCAPQGQSCTQEICDNSPKPCGDKFCAPGEYCCNANCGMCAPMGAMCIQIAC